MTLTAARCPNGLRVSRVTVDEDDVARVDVVYDEREDDLEFSTVIKEGPRWTPMDIGVVVQRTSLIQVIVELRILRMGRRELEDLVYDLNAIRAALPPERGEVLGEAARLLERLLEKVPLERSRSAG